MPNAHVRRVPKSPLRFLPRNPRITAQAKTVRAQVTLDRDQIAAEARTAVAEAVASGRLTKLTLLLRPDEQPILDALDRYAAEHGLKSRNQVLRAASRTFSISNSINPTGAGLQVSRGRKPTPPRKTGPVTWTRFLPGAERNAWPRFQTSHNPSAECVGALELSWWPAAEHVVGGGTDKEEICDKKSGPQLDRADIAIQSITMWPSRYQGELLCLPLNAPLMNLPV